jgi:8-oxo-dGTP pyrophosphatase MutT (NUDIX family)
MFDVMKFFSPPQRLSCGVLIVNAERELLLCHVTGQQHWDLPKGGMAAGETPLQTALRETQEETGLALTAEALLDLGRFDYRRRKRLHLFATLMPRLDPSTLHCASEFSDLGSGRRMPEMDDYAWVDFADVRRHTSQRMAAVLAGQIELEALLARLRTGPRRDDNGAARRPPAARDAPDHARAPEPALP